MNTKNPGVDDTLSGVEQVNRLVDKLKAVGGAVGRNNDILGRNLVKFADEVEAMGAHFLTALGRIAIGTQRMLDDLPDMDPAKRDALMASALRKVIDLSEAAIGAKVARQTTVLESPANDVPPAA